MSSPRVLISGAGIAGTVLAYWLAKHDFEVVIAERSSDPTVSQQGQIIDVEGSARDIVIRMGLLDKIKSQVTHEAGVRFVDASNRDLGTFPAGETSGSKEIEIMRPVLAKIFSEAADSFKKVEFRYGCTIVSVSQMATHVMIETKRRETGMTYQEKFDFLVVCDGLRSSTRDMILEPSERKDAIKSIGVFAAFFSVPAAPQDQPYARYYPAGGAKVISTKPLTEKETSCYLLYRTSDVRLREARESRDVDRQKELVAEYFAGAGWDTDRLLEGMKTTDNFYFEEISQVYLNKWSKGRCVLLGDTAYCPSPLTGQGTSLAILGAYVLAAKLVKHPQDPEQAFRDYEKDLRPYVNKVQPIPLGGRITYFTLPDTWFGILLIRILVGIASWLQIWKYLPAFFSVPYDLPDLE